MHFWKEVQLYNPFKHLENMSLLENIKNMILPQLGSMGGSKRNKSSLIIDELVYAFEESVERMSTPRSLMFHTAYVVYVPKNYYNELHLAFGVITKEVTDIYQEKLKEKLKRNKNLKFSPLFDSWSFDIIALAEEGRDTPDNDNPDSTVTYEELEEKFVAVRSCAVPNDIYNFTTLTDDDEIRTNKSQPNSKYGRIQRLSIGAIRGLKANGTGYMYPINLNGIDVSPDNNPVTSKVLAVLKSAEENVSFIDSQGKTYKSVDIELTDLFVGGSSASAMYQGVPMIRLNSETVLSPHFEIKQNADGAFYIRPLGDVEQGQIPLRKNEWARLSNKNASIIINGNIELIFNKK